MACTNIFVSLQRLVVLLSRSFYISFPDSVTTTTATAGICSCNVVTCIFQSSNVRTVIKTPGIQWTKEHGLQQQRWAHFSVDRKHHLLSILSRLSPSPDWCVGVSALDLCLDNCTWLADIMVRLFAWDAGVSSSDSHTSENWLNEPAQSIHHLPPRVNNNPGLVFRSGRPAEPVALLRLHRFYPKSDDEATECTNTVAKDQDRTNVDDTVTESSHPHQNSCKMGLWTQWSRCSVNCGNGTRTRTRTAVLMTDACSDIVQTTSEPCRAADCVGNCELHDWSEWSACSDGFTLCSSDDTRVGSCFRRRNRFYRRPGAEAFCNQTMDEHLPCQPSDTGVITAFNTDIMSKCFYPADSGPCDGNLLRWYYDAISSVCRTFLYGGCRGNANHYTTKEDCVRACRQYDRHMEQRSTDDGVATSHGEITGISTTTEATESDYVTLMQGHNVTTHTFAVDCAMSPWSAWSRCSVSCGRNGVRTRLRRVVRLPSGGGRKCPRRRLRRRRCSLPVCAETTRCQYTEWSSWSPCASSCDADTVQERIQRVQGSSSRRLLCPVKLQRRLCAVPSCSEN